MDLNYFITVDSNDVITGKYKGSQSLVSPWIAVTSAQFDAVVPNATWAGSQVVAPVIAAPTVAELFALLQGQAAAALTESDRTVLRCYENSVAVPAAWATYRAALRAIVNGSNATATALPAKPEYPAGT